MRAVVVEHLHQQGSLHEVPVPEPGPTDVLVRITVAGINPVDWKIRDEYGHALPFVLGQDFAGIVVGSGAAVKHYSQDDRVFGIAREHGAYAEYTVVPQDGKGQPIAHIPDSVGDADAAGLPTAGLTALAAIERMNVGAGLLRNSPRIAAPRSSASAQFRTRSFSRSSGSNCTSPMKSKRRPRRYAGAIPTASISCWISLATPRRSKVMPTC